MGRDEARWTLAGQKKRLIFKRFLFMNYVLSRLIFQNPGQSVTGPPIEMLGKNLKCFDLGPIKKYGPHQKYHLVRPRGAATRSLSDL